VEVVLEARPQVLRQEAALRARVMLVDYQPIARLQWSRDEAVAVAALVEPEAPQQQELPETEESV
jgi:hypothetical protein